jgi:hypothetical protein
MPIACADDWADALDKYQTDHAMSAGDLVSHACAAGEVVGITLDPRHPAADDERPHLAADNGWVVRYAPKYGWWEGVTWSLWTLVHEAAGSSDAAWVLRYGIGADTVVYETNPYLAPDDRSGAQEWGKRALASRHDTNVTDWIAYRPGPDTAPSHWIAKED